MNQIVVIPGASIGLMAVDHDATPPTATCVICDAQTTLPAPTPGTTTDLTINHEDGCPLPDLMQRLEAVEAASTLKPDIQAAREMAAARKATPSKGN